MFLQTVWEGLIRRRSSSDGLGYLVSMKRPSLLIALLFVSTSVDAQPPRPIGFADTLLFNDSLRYTAFGYDGPAPLFVQAWFPLDNPPVGVRLTYAQLRERMLEASLQRVHNELLFRMDSAFIEYCLRYPFDGDAPIDYTPFTEQQAKDSLFVLGTRAIKAELPMHGSRPVIVYHHGAQGLSDENAGMAEHFAANGFVFLSCNFHWPLENAMYGTPLTWEPDCSSIRTMLRFARQIANGGKVFCIGHSWGAQEGWCTLHEPGLADAFISLETTLEWKTDTAEVRDKWPHVLEAITTHRYPMPILLVADTEGEPPFPMFRGVRGDLRYLDPKQPFGHESFTSAYLLRLAGAGRFALPDREALQEQRELHAALLDELLAFLQAQAGMPSTIPQRPGGDPFHRY